MKRSIALLIFLLSFVTAFAQQPQAVEMADALRSSGKIYVVIATIVIIFIGLAIYLFTIDRRLKKSKKKSSLKNKLWLFKHSFYTNVTISIQYGDIINCEIDKICIKFASFIDKIIL
ncbi:CcmD family protein [Mucilaginibacter humi]|uniref:CcmD family protein n=1 Tax=Mucilaginibacter humi TaxID=2732510 RepID=UPI00293BD645|nr:hypothetical protein [Mucilaginibacter humi]